MLIYEPYATGHRLQHPAFIVNSFVESDRSGSLYVVVPRVFRETYKQYYDTNVDGLDRVEVIYLDELYLQRVSRISNPIARAVYELFFLRSFIRKYKIDAVHLDYLNRFFFSFFSLVGMHVKLTGIYYAPYLREKALDGFKLIQRIRRVRKFLQLWWTIRCKKIHRIHILNDQLVVDGLNQKYHTDKFSYLPDPIWTSSNSVPLSSSVGVKSHQGRIKFLVLGSLSREKGILQFFNGLRLLGEAGAVVVEDVPEDSVVAGNPARVIRSLV